MKSRTQTFSFPVLLTYFRSLLLLSNTSSCPRFSPTAADCGGSGSSNGEEKAGKAEGDAGPSCSSLSKDAGDAKSRFFDDSEESEEGEEEEGSDEEVRAGYQNKPFKLVVKAPSHWLWKHCNFIFLIRMAAKRKRVTVRLKRRRIQRRERKTPRMRRRRKCVYLEWMARRRCVQNGMSGWK